MGIYPIYPPRKTPALHLKFARFFIQNKNTFYYEMNFLSAPPTSHQTSISLRIPLCPLLGNAIPMLTAS